MHKTNSSIHSIGTRNKHHCPWPNSNLLVLIKCILAASKFSTFLPTWLKILKHEKANLRAALLKHLKAHFLYLVDEVSGMCKVDVSCCSTKCFIVIYNVKVCMFVCSWLLPHPTFFVTHSWKVNRFVFAYSCLNLRIWALWCDRPFIMGDKEDISIPLLSSYIINGSAWVILNSCCKISCVLQIILS